MVQHDASADASQKYASAPAGMRGEDEDRYGSGAEGVQMGSEAQDHQYGDIPNLTTEEIAALQPKKTKVVNPWIHEQTHQEYLENIIVSDTFLSSSGMSATRLTILFHQLLLQNSPEEAGLGSRYDRRLTCFVWRAWFNKNAPDVFGCPLLEIIIILLAGVSI